MSKGQDPAFLFYPGDFNEGTQIFTNEEVGAYLRILLLQFSHGHLELWQIQRKLGGDFKKLWEVISFKFSIDNDGKYYNGRLEFEQEKRANFTKSRRENLGRDKKDEHTDNERHYIL